MGSVFQLVLVCFCFELATSLPTKIHPPIWEYTYQYELFEKIYRQVQFLLTDVRTLSNNLSNRHCPQHWVTGNSACYNLVFYRKLNWINSQDACERLGGHLAVLDSEEKASFVSEFLHELIDSYELSSSNIWIGGMRPSKDGTWRWVSGDNVTNVDWEPDSTGSETGNRHCISATGQNWNAQRCSKDLHYLCEKQPTFQ